MQSPIINNMSITKFLAHNGVKPFLKANFDYCIATTSQDTVTIMFFSLDPMVTKTKLLNTKCQVKGFLSSSLKRDETAWPLLISKWDDNKKTLAGICV